MRGIKNLCEVHFFMGEKFEGISWLLVRLTLGFTMLWAFLDKAFGLGFSTCRDKTTGVYMGAMCEKAWFAGGSPTKGFLSNASGPLGSVFKGLAANPVMLNIVSLLFMLGMLGVGIALIAGAGLKIAGYSGAAIMVLMYFASFAPTNNPIMDDHLINAAVFILLTIKVEAGDYYGLGKWWKSQSFVQNNKWLE